MKVTRKASMHRSTPSETSRSEPMYNVIGQHHQVEDSHRDHNQTSNDDNDQKIDSRSQNRSIELNNMHQASWASCVVNLSSTILGAGILGVPYAISLMGWVPGIIALLFSATCSFFGLHLMAECALQLPATSSFYAVAKLTIPEYAILVDVLVTVKGFGTVTAYVLVIADSITSAFQSSSWLFLRSRFWVISLSYLIVGPLSYFPSLDSLRFFSALSVVMMLVLTFMIICYALELNDSIFDPCPNSHTITSECLGEQRLFEGNFSAALRAFPIMLFGFTCQQNAFTVVNELKDPTRKRLNSIFFSSIGISWSISMIVGVCGYATFGTMTTSDILRNYPVNALTSTCRVLMAIVVMCHYPLQVHPSRRTALSLWQRFRPVHSSSLSNMSSHSSSGASSPSPSSTSSINSNIQGYISSSMTSSQQSTIAANNFTVAAAEEANIFKRRFFLYTTFFNVVVYLVSISVQDLGVILSLMGATMSCLVILLLPGIFYYRLAAKTLPSMSSGSSPAAEGKRSSYSPVSLMMPPNNSPNNNNSRSSQISGFFSSAIQRLQNYLEGGVELLTRCSASMTATQQASTGRDSFSAAVSSVESPMQHSPLSGHDHDNHTDMDDFETISFHGSSSHSETSSLTTEHHSLYQDTGNVNMDMTRISEDVMPGIRWKRYAALMFFGFGLMVLIMSLTSVLLLSPSKGASLH